MRLLLPGTACKARKSGRTITHKWNTRSPARAPALSGNPKPAGRRRSGFRCARTDAFIFVDLDLHYTALFLDRRSDLLGFAARIAHIIASGDQEDRRLDAVDEIDGRAV